MGTQIVNQHSQLNQDSNIKTPRSSNSFHSLNSPRNAPKDHLTKKWVFSNLLEAQAKIKQLQNIENSGKNFVSSIYQLQIIQNNKKDYQVRGKVQCLEGSLKNQIQQRKKCGNHFSHDQIWNMTIKLCQIAIYLSKNDLHVPISLSEYAYINKLIKAKHQIYQTGVEKPQKIPVSIQKTVSRLIANICLLTLVESDVNLIEINRVNLQYNPNIATFIYTLKQERTAIKQLLNILKSDNSINCSKRSKSLIPTSKSILNKTKFYNQPTLHQSHQKVNPVYQSSISEQKTINTTKNSDITINRETFESNLNHKKMPEKQENKENQNRNESIDITNHHFPKKIKSFKRTYSQLGQSQLKNVKLRQSEIRNDVFIKLTGGERCNLFEKNSNESLLQSINYSEQSIIVKDAQSPTLTLNKDIESMAQDFLKFQQCIHQSPNQSDANSILHFVNMRNSTIIELTQENQQSGQKSQQKQIKIVDKGKIVSNFLQNSHNLEKFMMEDYEGGSHYEGYSVKGLRHGFGKLFYEDGGSYEGNWNCGQIDGFGKLYYQSGDLAYEGNWSNGLFHGEGKIINEKSDEIIGRFDYTDFGNIGTSWIEYEGNFLHDNKHGNGKIILSNGQIFTGNWKLNAVDGEGVFTTNEGEEMKGVWRNNILVSNQQIE